MLPESTLFYGLNHMPPTELERVIMRREVFRAGASLQGQRNRARRVVAILNDIQEMGCEICHKKIPPFVTEATSG